MVIHMSPDIDLRASRVYNAMSQGVLTAAAAIVLGVALGSLIGQVGLSVTMIVLARRAHQRIGGPVSNVHS